MNISDIAEEIVNSVQSGMADKIPPAKLQRGVVTILNKLVRSLSEAGVDDDYLVVVTMDSGVPQSVMSNNPALNGAVFVCTDNISVADDEDNVVIVYDDNIVVTTGEIVICDETATYLKAARKFERLNY
jgi:hypothetical protein